MAGRPISERAKRNARSSARGYDNIEIQIVRMNRAPTFNELTGMIEVSYNENYQGYEGSGRFWTSNDGQVISVFEGDYSTIATFISIAWDAEPVPELDDYVSIVTASDDPSLANRLYRIVGVDGGGVIRPSRRMQVTAVTDNRSTRAVS